ncbi:MAG: mechanosensitive ion channel family protein [Candidatus Aminicenantes bacterium]|nr:mechanosensitive ion channel family protein [Candidatus Aminicenantes bacterium]
MDFTSILAAIKTWTLSTGLKIVLIIVGTFILLKFVKGISSRLYDLLVKKEVDAESRKRAETLKSVIQNVLKIAVWILATMIILEHLGIKIGPLLAAAGIAGLAIGFAGQNLVKDIINGFFILLWDQIRVGDWVQIAGKAGLVERVNLKMTVLRDLSGNVHFVPNSAIDLVTNMTKDYSQYILEIGVAYREDVDEVMTVIKEVDEDLRNDPEFKDDILKPTEVLGLDNFADSALIIKARITTKPIKQWIIKREFNRRLKKKFNEMDIEIPFPHVTLYMGQDKKGQAPPMNISLEKES